MNMYCWTIHSFLVFWLFAFGNPLTLTPYPQEATLGEKFSLICSVDVSPVYFESNSSTKCTIGQLGNGSCVKSGNCQADLEHTCATSTYTLIFPGQFNVDVYHNTNWICRPSSGGVITSNTVTVIVRVPVNDATITPVGYNNVVGVVVGQQQLFTCTTDSSRPAAWIQWYINKRNVTNDAVQQPAKHNGTKLISTSQLTYTGNESDYNQTVHCEAVNIEGIRKVQSTNKILYIQVPVTRAIITPDGGETILSVVLKETQKFTCTTDSGRPAAWIQWYIGIRNITNDAVPQQPQLYGSKFISSSILMYTGNDYDHTEYMYCEAVNIEEMRKVKSVGQTIYIQVSVASAVIKPDGINNAVNIVSGGNQMFNCTTDSGRPAAWIQWYIGTRNITNDAVPQQPQIDGFKFISSSILMYTGNDSDHTKLIYCTAVNIEGKQVVKSMEKTIFIEGIFKSRK